jgi:hypothetical protein
MCAILISVLAGLSMDDIRDGVKRAAIGDTGEVYAADFIEM